MGKYRKGYRDKREALLIVMSIINKIENKVMSYMLNIDKIENSVMSYMLNIDKKTVIPFVYIVLILIGIDLITTYIGINIGLEEGNIVTLFFMERHGYIYGLLASIFGKAIFVVFPLILYRYISKGLDKTLNNIPLRNIYWILYLTVIIFLTMITTFFADVSNIIYIMETITLEQ